MTQYRQIGAWCMLGLALGCAPAEEREPIASLELSGVGFMSPESVLHDAAADVYLVSNINGSPLAKDDNGFISRVSPTGEVTELKWIDGADDAVTLNGPKGLAIKGDTLFVADIDAVRLFDRTAGTPLGALPVAGATFLNDLSVGPDGTLYATDSGLRAGASGFEDSGTDAVYRFDTTGAHRLASGPALGRPNGVVAGENGVTVVTFGSGTMYRLDPASGDRTDLPIPEQGQLDGVVALDDGSLLISSWAGQMVYRLAPDGSLSVAVDSIPSPADIGYDAQRGRVLIPVFLEDRVVVREVR